ncbi:MAG: hypothetical protein HYT76_10030 [Deltaproteobacteria bacterium]|nr:hypothetical protein [Deltaproteobacteria bacterium]
MNVVSSLLLRDSPAARGTRRLICRRLTKLKGQFHAYDYEELRELVGRHSREVGLPLLTQDSRYARKYPPWQFKLHTELDAQYGRAVRKVHPRSHLVYYEADFEVVAVPAQRVVPYHYLNLIPDNGSERGPLYLDKINDLRGLIIYRLMDRGWKPGSLPTEQMIQGALTCVGATYESLNIYGPTPAGLYLLRNGHHRFAALMTLVNDGVLPAEVLQLPKLARYKFMDPAPVVAKVERRHPGGIGSFGWAAVLSFNRQQSIGVRELGLVGDLSNLS